MVDDGEEVRVSQSVGSLLVQQSHHAAQTVGVHGCLDNRYSCSYHH